MTKQKLNKRRIPQDASIHNLKANQKKLDLSLKNAEDQFKFHCQATLPEFESRKLQIKFDYRLTLRVFPSDFARSVILVFNKPIHKDLLEQVIKDALTQMV